ncbi:MAG: hypothetical protein KIH65_001785 [Candidatus Uhrbacteria bacterium]|nr:hypothetical protein [Candidatus Uhrbacteria bacterium]
MNARQSDFEPLPKVPSIVELPRTPSQESVLLSALLDDPRLVTLGRVRQILTSQGPIDMTIRRGNVFADEAQAYIEIGIAPPSMDRVPRDRRRSSTS